MFNSYGISIKTKPSAVHEFSLLNRMDKNFIYKQIEEAKEALENYTGKRLHETDADRIRYANQRLYKKYNIKLDKAGINRMLDEIKKQGQSDIFAKSLMQNRSKNYVPWITVRYVPFGTKLNLNASEIETICENDNCRAKLAVNILGIDKYTSSLGNSLKTYNDKFIKFDRSVFNANLYLNKIKLLYNTENYIDNLTSNFYDITDLLASGSLSQSAYKKLYDFILDLIDESVIAFKRENKDASWKFDEFVTFYEGMMWKKQMEDRR